MIGDPWRAARRDAYRLGRNIRRIRTLAGMKQSELAEMIGLDGPQMSRIERGESIPYGHQALSLTAWIDDQTRLQTPYSDATAVPALPPRVATPTPPRATHPVTSRRAVDSVDRETAWAIHRWIIEQLETQCTGGYVTPGMTHEQFWNLHRARFGDPPPSSQSGLRTRVSELVRGGVIQDSGRTRTMTTGRQAIVWELVDHPTNTG